MLMGIHALALPKLDPGPGLSNDEGRELERTRSNMESFADEGTLLRGRLIQVLHDEASIRDFDHPQMRAWIKAAGELNMRAIKQ